MFPWPGIMVYSQLAWWRGRGKVESRKYLCQRFWLLRSCIHARAASRWMYSTILLLVDVDCGQFTHLNLNHKGTLVFENWGNNTKVKSIWSMRIMWYLCNNNNTDFQLNSMFNEMNWRAFPSTISTAISVLYSLKLPVEHSILTAGGGRAATCCRHLHGTS